MTITCILVIFAFVITIFAATERAPLWVGVLLLTIAMLLSCLPR